MLRGRAEQVAHARAQDEALAMAHAFLAHMRVYWTEVAPCSCHQIEGHAPDCAYERTMEALREGFFEARAGA
jgi:hypothetical protein